MTRLRCFVAVFGIAILLTGCGAVRENTRPMCRYGSPAVVMAQSVPSAQLIPCVRVLPPGWSFAGFDARSGRSRFWLNSDVAGGEAVVVELTAECNGASGEELESDESGTRLSVYQGTGPLDPETWTYRYDGGCTTYRITLGEQRIPLLERQLQDGLAFITRASLDREHRERMGRPLDSSS